MKVHRLVACEVYIPWKFRTYSWRGGGGGGGSNTKKKKVGTKKKEKKLTVKSSNDERNAGPGGWLVSTTWRRPQRHCFTGNTTQHN